MEKGVLTLHEAENVLAALAVIQAAKKKIGGSDISVFDSTLQEHCRIVIATTGVKKHFNQI